MDHPKPTQDMALIKSKFLIDMLHESENSMKDILKKGDMLKQTKLDDKQIEYIESIDARAHKLSWIINDIIDFSQLEIGKIELQSINFNLQYLINDIFTKIIKQIVGLPVDTYIDIDKDVQENLIGDPTRLRQALVTLLSNAFKHTAKGEIGVIVRNASSKEDTSTSNDVKLQITVKDSGKGIPEEKLKKIFEVNPSDSSKAWESGGTGLGLVICKLIVEAMGGSINAESKVDKGSQFTLNLTFKKGESPLDRKVYPLTKGELVGKRAMIVDDNEIARKILKKCCETMGIEPVLISASPVSVLKALDESSVDTMPDLIICDIMMPEMDGYEMVKRLRAKEKFKNIKIIAVTSAVHIGSACSAQDSGFSGFLPKPVFLDELAKIITTVLGDKQDDVAIVTRHMAEELKFKGTKIIVIIENGSDQQLIEDCLEVMECERQYVLNGQQAIEILKEQIFNLCLLDFRVFSGEGSEIIRIIKDLSRSMPIAALLTADQENHRMECLDAGIDDFIIKPVDMISMKRIIKRYSKI